MSEKRAMRQKRKLTDMNDEATVGQISPQKSSLLSTLNTMSPASSPLKGPLVEESGSSSFAAKCFYGFKTSLSVQTKENNLSPKKKMKPVKPLKSENKPQILHNSHLNKKLLDRIAASPIKQAVLQRCSMEEFRKLYRDEIKEMEEEEKLAERRITRKLSKIIWRQSEDSDEDVWESSSSDDGISFKISNRGFDVDSISNGSSSIQSHMCTPVKKDISNITANSVKKNKPLCSKDESSDEVQKTPCKTPPSAVSSSERKFFKSKSVGKSVGTSNVLLGKGFNLRFIRQSKSCGVKKKGKNKTYTRPKSNIDNRFTLVEKQRLSCEDAQGSTLLSESNTTSSQGSLSNETTPSRSRMSVRKTEKYTGDDFDDLDLVVMRRDNAKTYDLLSPKRQRLDYSSVSESPCDSTKDHSPRCQSKGINNNSGDNNSHDVKDAASKSHEQGNETAVEDYADLPSLKKLFPIFRQRTPRSITESNTSMANSGRLSNKIGKDDQNQMMIDAGQKSFGATQCKVCGMVYCQADPTDETAHAKFHKRLLEVLRFPGWKKERVVQESPMDCGRIILVLSDDPKFHRKKVDEIYEVMGRELGFPGDSSFTNPYQKVFLYISVDKEIEGCCVAESIKEGNRVIPGDLDANDASGRRPWCCEKVPEPALIGISRLWVAGQKRRSGIASRLMEAVQQWFDYGSFIPKDKIAFSDPTPDGRRFAHKFMGTPTFLVYKYKYN